MPPVVEPPLLLFFADIQVVLHDLNTGADQHVLEGNYISQKVLIFSVGAEPHHAFNAGTIVPAAIEEHQFLRRRQMRSVALEVPRDAILVRGLAERHDADFTRAEMLGDAPNGAVLSTRIA